MKPALVVKLGGKPSDTYKPSTAMGEGDDMEGEEDPFKAGFDAFRAAFKADDAGAARKAFRLMAAACEDDESDEDEGI